MTTRADTRYVIDKLAWMRAQGIWPNGLRYLWSNNRRLRWSSLRTWAWA